MATPVIESSFTSGEVAPALFGNVALARMHAAAATMRNFFVAYQGGAYSRAGTAFCGYSKQIGSSFPPRMITFQFSISQGLALEFGNFYMRVLSNGAYVTETAVGISSVIDSAPVQIFFGAAPPFVTGDWVFIQGIVGPSSLNNQSYIVTVSGLSILLFDVFGNPVNGVGLPAYVSGGTAARIFTLGTQWAEADLKWLKWTQSADVMSICCVNQSTGTEYPPLDLARISDTNWTFTPAVPAPTVLPPTAVNSSASSTGAASYLYSVTAVSPIDGSESVGRFGSITGAVDVASTPGSITLTWPPVADVNEYNIYKATVVISGNISLASLCGFAGSAYGPQFIDSNIVPDLAQVPPVHRDPFARGQTTFVTPVSNGSGYTSFPTVTVVSATGTGAVYLPVVVGGGVTGYVQQDAGKNYKPGDTVVISGGGGTGATATLTVGALTGTYPAVVTYFQQRRAYAYTLNQPDTYFMSQPGSYTNFDSRIPTIDTDAITGTPWAVEVNGIQFMISVTGGLMVLTGLEAYFLAGAGSSPFQAQPLTPSSQSAIPQGFNGCSQTIAPIRIYQDVLYVQAKGSTYRDFSFNIQTYTYTGDDITQNSTQLFNNFTMVEHAWCEEPYRLLWAVRNDGALLSLTYVKTEKVIGWARHDTQGLFKSLCSVTEPPVDALYLATQRTIAGRTAYIVERMNDRLWNTIEDAFCVDCGFTLPVSNPVASLTVDLPAGLGSLTGVTSLIGGSGYSAGTTATVVDDNGNGPGAGAVATVTVVAGVITAIAFPVGGAGYTYPALVINDPAGSAGGSGASAAPILNNAAPFTASAAVFQMSDIGRVIRVGGGVATVQAFVSVTQVVANITTPITATQYDVVNPQAAGSWSISTPITVVNGLAPLNGTKVTGLADGVVIPPQTVVNGSITLGTPASQITVGLSFHARLQSTYLDAGEPTVQGQRGLIAAATARVSSSGQFEMGENQIDGSTLSPIQIAPPWRNMQVAAVTTRAPYNSKTVPLCNDDIRIPINTGYSKHKQVAVQQTLPLPLQVLALVPEFLTGDKPSQEAPQRQNRAK